MMLPSILHDNFFEDVFGDFFGDYRPAHGRSSGNLMRTDVKETDGTYEVDIDLPGFRKEDINAKLEKGYLTITAAQDQSNDEKDENGKYIRRERHVGTCSRSFYVGDHMTEEDIHAKYENGILKLSIPKKEAKQIEEQKFIAIEG